MHQESNPESLDLVDDQVCHMEKAFLPLDTGEGMAGCSMMNKFLDDLRADVSRFLVTEV